MMSVGEHINHYIDQRAHILHNDHLKIITILVVLNLNVFLTADVFTDLFHICFNIDIMGFDF